MLYYSSFLFGTIAIHAYFIRDLYYNISFLFLMGISILNHARMYDENGNLINCIERDVVGIIDRILAHIITIISAYHAYQYPLGFDIFLYWISLVYTGYIYYTKCKHASDPKNIWHASIHLISVLGIHSLLLVKNREKIMV